MYVVVVSFTRYFFWRDFWSRKENFLQVVTRVRFFSYIIEQMLSGWPQRGEPRVNLYNHYGTVDTTTTL
jgi:hypothetical protein